MNRPHLELADVFKALDSDSSKTDTVSLSSQQRRAFQDIIQCRSVALGGHVERCTKCSHEQISYNSCRNRHCPKCQAAARKEWTQERAAELLPVEYFHVVFTLPDQLSPVALQNKRVIYGLLFQAASETLLKIAGDPKHLGAAIGFLAVLHTWGQTLQHHPHLHCVVPGGGLSPDHSRWIGCRKGFFLPVKVLSRLFRRKFVAYLKAANEQGRLVFHGQSKYLAECDRFAGLLNEVSKREWVVYAKRPFGGPVQVLKYLARYTHRVAISNHRLVSLSEGKVTFRWKDYAEGNAVKEMTLEVREFTRRFLLHILPRGFVRIRHYGFLANRCRSERLERCHRLLACGSDQPMSPESENEVDSQCTADREPQLCPVCRIGRMIILKKFDPLGSGLPTSFVLVATPDTS